jgi:hypothetical protein
MFYRAPRVRGTSRSPTAGLATGTIFKRTPERAVDEEDKRTHKRREEGEEPAEPETQAQSEHDQRRRS